MLTGFVVLGSVVVALGLAGLVGRCIRCLAASDVPPTGSLLLDPLVGTGSLALWFGIVGWLIPPGGDVALIVSGCFGVVLVAATFIRFGRGFVAKHRELRVVLVVAMVGLVMGAPFLALIARSDSSSAAMLSPNHDAFYFVAVPEWLTDHTIGDAPDLEEGPPSVAAYASVYDRYDRFSLRVGSESLTAAVSASTGVDPLLLWWPVTLAYLVLLAFGGAHLASVTRGWNWSVVVGAVVAASSAAAIGAVTEQHTPSLLALALAMGLVGEIMRIANTASLQYPSIADSVVPGLLIASIGAVYAEILVLIVPATVILVMSASLRVGRMPMRWIITTAASALILGSVVWWRAALAIERSEPPVGYVSAFSRGRGGYFSALVRVPRGASHEEVAIGAASILALFVLLAFFLVLIVGLAWTFRTDRARSWWIGFAATVPIGWVLFGAGSGGYPQQRWVEWALPFVLVGSAMGWVAIARPATPLQGRGRTLMALSMAGLLFLTLPGLAALARTADDPTRRVDASFDDAHAWLDSRDPSGASTLVWSGGFFENLWTPYLLRDLERTSYLSLYGGYFDLTSSGDADAVDWLLLDRTALAEVSKLGPIPEGIIVEETDRFVLLDLRSAEILLPSPAGGAGPANCQGPEARVLIGRGAVVCAS